MIKNDKKEEWSVTTFKHSKIFFKEFFEDNTELALDRYCEQCVKLGYGDYKNMRKHIKTFGTQILIANDGYKVVMKRELV